MSNNRGDRNRLLVIERRSGAVDESNQPINDDWVFVMNRWAEAKTLTGMGAVRAAAEGVPAGPTRYSWRINYTPTGIDTGMRAKYRDTVFDIVDIRHDFKDREFTDLVCDFGANNG